ncbi:hypothetical protein FB45DRAFT_507396 [Roridomyces roridus]|uniref:ARM repeat-containing protein n=1 Tax=Roridomyces roridus TaxID=1738132 RepID=A0AAD7FMN7_9AGAR|nr:hypothetical protein FB45DRAFT_507396 [Roridomyces roridus]
MAATVDLTPLGHKLSEVACQISKSESPEAWKEVENIAQSLANGLRVRDGPVDNHTALGQTPLPQALNTLFTRALHGSTIPALPYIPAVFEILRVSANLCMDHDDNRALLLEAGLPQAIVSLLEAYAETIPSPPSTTPLPLTIPHLKIVRTAIGVLLNASLNYDPVKARLRSLDSGLTILKLSNAIYPPASWLTAAPSSPEENTPESQEESWTIRSGVSSWAWRIIVDLKEVKDDETIQIFNPDVLPLLTPALTAFCPPYPSASTLFRADSDIFETLLHADFDVLEESCTLIESLSLDVEDVRLSLARGLNFPAEHGGVPCLCTILDFVEKGDYPPFWQTVFPEADRKRRERVFDNCKAALIKSVVEVAGEERNEDVLWDDSEDKPGGEFVCRMVDLIKKYVSDMDQTVPGTAVSKDTLAGRDDLVICASLSLGNLARREKNSVVLLSPPHSIANFLTVPHLLSPSTDIKVKHGIIGLLKHLAQSCAQSTLIHDALFKAEVVKRVSTSGVWDEKADEMADIVQVGAIGIVKYMCNANVENTFVLVLPTPGEDHPTGLSQILALVKRTKSTPVRSEGTRVLVNAIKSLWSNDPAANAENAEITAALAEVQRKRHESMQIVLTPECAFALASLVGRSAKYPLLVNEGVVALSLMCTIPAGGPIALTAILTPLPLDTPEPPSAPQSASGDLTSGSDVSSPVVATPSTSRGRLLLPRSALDMLIAVLRNVDNPVNFQVEVRANVCAFFAQLTRHTSGPELVRVKDRVRPVVESLTEQEEMLAKASKKLLDLWA